MCRFTTAQSSLLCKDLCILPCKSPWLSAFAAAARPPCQHLMFVLCDFDIVCLSAIWSKQASEFASFSADCGAEESLAHGSCAVRYQ